MVELGWVRRLARALLDDHAAADDIAQETWLVAASRKPDEHRPLGPWLARVVRNLAHTRRRSEARRDRREAVYEGQAVATPEELIDRVELQRVVAGEVLALAEPYRSTVLLHFFEGLTSAQIARRLDIPDGTVRRRLKTALDQLRERLEARDDRPNRGWLGALAPLATPPVPPSTFVGALIVKKIIAVIVVLALVISGAWLWKHRGEHGSAPAAAVSGSNARPTALVHGTLDHVPEWALQVNAPARKIAGRVIATGGASIAGATVRIGIQVGDDLVQPIAEITTGADGSFDFGMRPAAELTVTAQADNNASASLVVHAADPRAKTDQLVLVLGNCRSRMSGTISDASGGAIAKVRLSLDLASTESDTNGRYAICLAPRGSDNPTAFVRLEADGYGTTSERVVVTGELHEDFVMVPEAVLVGRVVTTDEHPVAGARVLATPDAIEGPHHLMSNWAESDVDGHFRIAGLAPGKFHLSAITRTLGSSVPVVAFARATTTSKELRIVVSPLARVTGRVVMGDAPVAGARVVAARPGPGAPSGPSAFSQSDGTFTLDSVPFGTVAFSAAPFAVDKPKTLDVKAAQTAGVVIEVGKLATLRGHITRKGKPVASADVVFLPPAAPPMSVKSDAEGAYVLEGLPPGAGRVQASSLDPKAFANAKMVQLAIGADSTQDIELEFAGEVKGTVVDQDGKPVAGVYVDIELIEGGDHGDSTTDAEGNFDCGSMTGGEYTAKVAPSPSSGQHFAPATGDKLPTITVPKDGVVTGVRIAIKNERLAIRGTVVDDTGAAVPDVHVEAIGHGFPVMMDLASVMTDASGKFVISDLARGTYNIHAHAADGSETEVLDIPTAGDPITITLARPGAIEGTLVGFSTTPIVESNTLTADLHIGGSAVVEGNTFSIVGLPPGKYTIEAKAGVEVDGAAVDVRSGETAHVTLTSRGSGHVEGTVTELATKVPVVGMRCDGNLSMGGQMSASPPDESREAFTDAAGHFSLATPTGRIRVFCFNPAGGPMSIAGTDVDVVIGTVPHVGLVSVRAMFGQPPNVGFDLVPLTLPITVNTVAPGGPGAAAGVVPGDHVVTVDGQSLQGMLPEGVQFMLFDHHSGSTITLELERGGVARTTKVLVR